MILLKRGTSGLYFDQSLAPSAARFAFLFADENRQDPTFTLSASSWADSKTMGLVACFLPEDRPD